MNCEREVPELGVSVTTKIPQLTGSITTHHAEFAAKSLASWTVRTTKTKGMAFGEHFRGDF